MPLEVSTLTLRSWSSYRYLNRLIFVWLLHFETQEFCARLCADNTTDIIKKIWLVPGLDPGPGPSIAWWHPYALHTGGQPCYLLSHRHFPISSLWLNSCTIFWQTCIAVCGLLTLNSLPQEIRLLSRSDIPGVTLCFCAGSYAAATGRWFLFTR